MANLEEVASIARPVLKGIDWDALAAKGPNEHGVARNSVFALDYYYDYMRPAGLKAGKVRDTLDLDVTAEEAYAHFKDSYTAVKSVSNLAYEAAVQQIPVLSEGSSMKMGLETFRSAVAICWFSALYGAELHRTGAMVLSGRFSEEEIVRHASLITGMFESISLLNDWGLLDAIKKGKPRGTSGVGLMPVAIGAAPLVVVAIAAVIAIAVVAFMILSIMDVSEKNALIKNECESARASGNSDLYEKCLNALKSPNETIGTQLYKDTIQEFAPYIAAIVGGVLLITIAPFVVSRLSKAGEVGRRAKRRRREKYMQEYGY